MDHPEARIARRLVQRLELSPPVDIKSLVHSYAELSFKKIPEACIDGICLNLKVSGKRPTVIVNSDNPPNRKRFTLAHELGHILIPWHLGSIIDNLDVEESSTIYDYWQMEKEANTFAAEVLMPYEWVDNLTDDVENLAESHKTIAQDCEVSGLAAALRLISFFEPGVVYAVTSGGAVEYSGRSEGTIASALPWNTPFSPKSYSYAQDHHTAKLGTSTLHWWILPSEVPVEDVDSRTWRELVDRIVSDICKSDDDARKLKQSVNGVMGYANSMAKRSSNYSPDAVASASFQRFFDRSEYKAFVAHRDFKTYVFKRSQSFFS
ncbi:MAG: ImmA/IrrE family metallo-endopeptidase [Candidatus Thiodiazotropha lotti]